MKNITVKVDEKVLSAARQHAAAHSTSVNQLVRDFLGEIAQRENRARTARLRLRSLSNRSQAKVGGASLNRKNLYQ